MDHLRLNWDLLLIILQATTRRQDISRMMKTCRMLHSAGIPLLLKPGVIVSSPGPLSSFCAFMQADRTRFRYLRCLELSIGLDLIRRRQLGKEVTSMLQGSKALEELYMHSNVLEIESDTLDVIAKLTTLKRLSLTNGASSSRDLERLKDMLCRLESPLRSLIVHLECRGAFTDPDDPFPLLSGISQYLEHLHVRCASFAEYDGLSFPHMKALSCEDTWAQDCGVLLQAFPNLTHLALCRQNWRDAETHRLENLAVWSTLRWPHLTFLSGDLTSLYGLAVQCPVTTLEVHYVLLDEPAPEDAERLYQVLIDTTPTHLELDLRLDVDANISLSALKTVLESISSQLVRLVLRLRIHHEEGMPFEYFDGILNALAAPKLTYLKLELHWAEPLERVYDMWAPENRHMATVESQETFHPITQALREMDPLICAQQITAAMGSLKTVCLSWDRGNGGPEVDPFVTIVESPGRSLKVLDEIEGQSLVKEIEDGWHSTLSFPVQKSEILLLGRRAKYIF